MADRIIAMRERLFNKLVELKTPGEWKHIKSQIGMFSFTGLKPEQVDALAEKAHIYLTRDGRISMAALNESNVEVSHSLQLWAKSLIISTSPRAFRRLLRESYRYWGRRRRVRSKNMHSDVDGFGDLA